MDAMRAVLALAVAFGHAWALVIRDRQPGDGWLADGLRAAAGFAHPAVMMFFVLSGYWIGRSVMARADRGWAWGDYLIDRASRLLVVLVPALVLGAALDMAGLWVLHTPTHWGRTASWVLHKDVARDLSLAGLAGNLLFLQGILVRPLGSNGPLWSLAAEWWFYLWFAALYLAWHRRRASATLAVLLVGLLAPELVRLFAVWGCGAVLAGLERAGATAPGTDARGRRWRTGAAVAVFGAALLAARLDGAMWEDWGLGIGFAALLWALMLAPPGSGRVPGMRVLARYGAGASFSLYAIHFPVMAMVAGLGVGEARLAPDARGLATVAAAMASAVVASLAFARVTEARTAQVRAWLHRTAGSWRATPVAGAGMRPAGQP